MSTYLKVETTYSPEKIYDHLDGKALKDGEILTIRTNDGEFDHVIKVHTVYTRLKDESRDEIHYVPDTRAYLLDRNRVSMLGLRNSSFEVKRRNS